MCTTQNSSKILSHIWVGPSIITKPYIFQIIFSLPSLSIYIYIYIYIYREREREMVDFSTSDKMIKISRKVDKPNTNDGFPSFSLKLIHLDKSLMKPDTLDST